MRTAKKCHRCGLVNFASESHCRRCSSNLDSAPMAMVSEPKVSKSTVYVLLFAFVFAGLGVWGFLYRRGVDRELAQKAEFLRRQGNYNGPPLPDPKFKRMNEIMEEKQRKEPDQKKALEEVMKKIEAPTPIP